MAKKYFLFILGCAMNYSDAERIAAVFEAAGYEATADEKQADIVVTVACSVRQVAIDRIHGKTKGWDKRRRKNPEFKTVLSGCVLPEDKKKLAKSFDLIFDIESTDALKRFLYCHSTLDAESSTKSKKIPASAGRTSVSRDYMSIVPKYESTFRAFVPIMTGCDNYCSYCAVPYTRGREKSRPEAEILAEVRNLIERGYKEITLLGQNVNSYQPQSKSVRAGGALQRTDLCKADKGPSFVNLLKKIDQIGGGYRVYFYSNHPKDVSDELIRTLPKLKHFPHYLHLPLQSGDDDILRQMNRHYTAAQYLELVAKIRAAIPDLVLTTDVMVGFPGESEEKFAHTIKVMDGAKFEMAFIAQYSPRVGTVSAKITDDVPKAVKKERAKILTATVRENLEQVNKKFVGKILEVLIDEKKGSTFFGRTDGYKVVEIKTDQPLEIGRFYKAKITKSSAWKLFATLG